MHRHRRHRRALLVGVLIAIPACNDYQLVPTPSVGEPPVAVLEASASQLATLDTAWLDGSASYDPDSPGPDAIAQYSWTLVSAPLGSSTQIVDEGSAARLWFDVAGAYEVELIVADRQGQRSEPARVVLEAIPFEEIHVELSWDTGGTDVDLHLVSVSDGGAFFASPHDCYYANAAPDWGPSGPLGNPSLDIDDIDGFGPENVNIAAPEPQHDYRLLVHYYDDAGWGATDARVRVYLSGALQLDQTQTLTRTDTVWDVALIRWPTGEIAPIDDVFQR